MATMTEQSAWYSTHASVQNPADAFSPAERRALENDDLFAGKTVSGILVSIVTLGMILMLLTVVGYCLN